MSTNTKTEEFADLAHRAINEAQRKTESLRARADVASAEGRHEIERKIENLTAQQNELQQKLDQLKESGNEASGVFLEGCRDAWRRFNDAIDDAANTLDRSS